MQSIFQSTKTLKELFLIWEHSKKDPSTFYSIFGIRQSSFISILNPVVLLSNFRKSMRLLQALGRDQSFPLLIFFNLKNKFLKRQLYFLSLRFNWVLVVDINDINIYSIYPKKINIFCSLGLFLTPEQEYQLAIQSQIKRFPTIFFKSPTSNNHRGDGSLVSNVDSFPAQMLIIHWLTLGLAQISKSNC